MREMNSKQEQGEGEVLTAVVRGRDMRHTTARAPGSLAIGRSILRIVSAVGISPFVSASYSADWSNLVPH